MKVILFVTIIVLGGLSLATWLCMHLEDHLNGGNGTYHGARNSHPVHWNTGSMTGCS